MHKNADRKTAFRLPCTRAEVCAHTHKGLMSWHYPLCDERGQCWSEFSFLLNGTHTHTHTWGQTRSLNWVSRFVCTFQSCPCHDIDAVLKRFSHDYGTQERCCVLCSDAVKARKKRYSRSLNFKWFENLVFTPGTHISNDKRGGKMGSKLLRWSLASGDYMRRKWILCGVCVCNWLRLNSV